MNHFGGRPNSVRGFDGRFAEKRAQRCTLGHARLMYDSYLAAVCAHQGLQLAEVRAQLKRPVHEIKRGGGAPTSSPIGATGGRCGQGRFRFKGSGGARIVTDRNWKAAVYARQLALYLANTVDNVPQVLLAQVTGLTPAAVCVALRAIEDLREHRDYDAAVDLIGAEMAAAQGAGA